MSDNPSDWAVNAPARHPEHGHGVVRSYSSKQVGDEPEFVTHANVAFGGSMHTFEDDALGDLVLLKVRP